MELYRKAITGVVWSVTGQFGGQLISFLVLLVLARLLVPESFGLVALAGVVTRFSLLFLQSGLTSAIVQRQQLAKAHLDTAFWLNLIFAGILTFALIAGSEYAARLLRNPDLAPIIRWLSPTLIFTALNQVQSQILARQMSFGTLAKRNLIATLISGVVAVAAAIKGFGVWSLVIRAICNQLVTTLVLWNSSQWRPGSEFSINHARELVSFGISQMGSNVSNFVRMQGTVAIIGTFLGTTVLGYYYLADRLCTLILNTGVDQIGRVSWPMYSRLQAEPDKLRNAYLGVARFSAIIAMPLIWGLIVIAWQFIPIAFGEQWNPVVPVLVVLAVQAFFHAVVAPMFGVFLAIGRPAARFWILSVETALCILGAVYFAAYGLVAIAIWFAVSAAIVSPIAFHLLAKLVKIRFGAYLKQTWSPLIAALAMAGVVQLTGIYLSNRVAAEIVLVFSVGIGALTYTSVLLLIDSQVIADIRGVSAVLFRSQRTTNQAGVDR